jgi:magnesium transporter
VRVLTEPDVDQLRALQARDELVWLDLQDPDEATLAAVGAAIGLHELAIEDSRDFHQRPKLDRYGERLLLVFYGLHLTDGTPEAVEVHIHIAGSCVLTISRVPPVQLERVVESLKPGAQCSRGELVYRVIDAVADSLVDGLDSVGDEVDAFEDRIFESPRARDRDRMAVLRHSLGGLRRLLFVQRQVFERAVEPIVEIAADGENIRPYLDDVSDHLMRALDETEADRETLREMLDTYAGEVQERLTIVATIFLPLTALTGFFGMNFNWMIDHLGSAWTFFGIGLGGLLVSATLIIAWLRYTGLIAGRSSSGGGRRRSSRRRAA